MKELSGTAVPGFLYEFDIAKFKQTIRDTINLDRLVLQSIDNPVLNKKFFLYSKLYFILEHVNKLINKSCINGAMLNLSHMAQRQDHHLKELKGFNNTLRNMMRDSVNSH